MTVVCLFFSLSLMNLFLYCKLSMTNVVARGVCICVCARAIYFMNSNVSVVRTKPCALKRLLLTHATIMIMRTVCEPEHECAAAHEPSRFQFDCRMPLIVFVFEWARARSQIVVLYI